MRERFAIAIPFHSGLAYLEQALASVRAQSDPEWSLLVLDDSGVESGARALVEGLADGRVRFRANPANLGMVASWNRCLDEAEGELVTLLHADDHLLPDYVARMRQLARAHPGAVALFCPAHIIDAAGARRFSLQDDIKRLLVPRGGQEVRLAGEPGLRALMRGNFVVCPTLCWRRAVLAERRFEARWRQVQDLDLMARLLLSGETLVGARVPLYAYRRHAANATARQTESLVRFEEEFELFERIADQAGACGWRRAERTSRRKRILRLHLAWRALSELVRLRPGPAGRYARFLSGARRPRA